MTYYIAKTYPGFSDSVLVVRALRKGGLSMDVHQWFPLDRCPVHFFARQFKTRAAAEKVLGKLHDIGGFTDFSIFEVEQ